MSFSVSHLRARLIYEFRRIKCIVFISDLGSVCYRYQIDLRPDRHNLTYKNVNLRIIISSLRRHETCRLMYGALIKRCECFAHSVVCALCANVPYVKQLHDVRRTAKNNTVCFRPTRMLPLLLAAKALLLKRSGSVPGRS